MKVADSFESKGGENLDKVFKNIQPRKQEVKGKNLSTHEKRTKLFPGAPSILVHRMDIIFIQYWIEIHI